MIAFYAILFVIGVGALRALILQWLWNLVIVGHFDCPITLTFWTAWGLILIGSLIFTHSPVQLKGE